MKPNKQQEQITRNVWKSQNVQQEKDLQGVQNHVATSMTINFPTSNNYIDLDEQQQDALEHMDTYSSTL